MEMPWLTILVFLPFAGAFYILLTRMGDRWIRWTALTVSLAEILISLVLVFRFDINGEGFQFREHHVWVDEIGIDYIVGLDGISLPLVAASYQ